MHFVNSRHTHLDSRHVIIITILPFTSDVALRERNIREIYSMYEVSFATLSERFYKASPWPPVELIADLVDQDHVFCLLYRV
jgi:hypothetical protein